MIEGLKPYPAYKASGLLGLGPVPAHWETPLNQRIFRECIRPIDGVRETPLSLSQKQGLVATSAMQENSLKTASYENWKVTIPGDLVLNRFKAHLGVFFAATMRGMVSFHYGVFAPTREVNTKYFEHLYHTIAYRNIYAGMSNGMTVGLQNLSNQNFYNVRSVVPPTREQAAIVRFLDHACGRIEKAIRVKRKMIALLNEQKQAIIHRAVTRGLDPDVPLKPSEVPWLGEIPAHWEVSRVKNEFLCFNTRRVPLNAVERGAMKSKTYDYYGASGVIDKVDNYLFDDELLLIAEDGANLVLRNLPLAIIARGKFWVNNHAHILRPTRGNINYLAHFLETLNYRPWISGAAQPKLTQDRLFSIQIAVAPPTEQDAIIQRTLEQTHPLSTTIAHLNQELTLLREYRTRLVADVVTGKVDVREAAARLPDEGPADLEPALDDAGDLDPDAEDVDDSADEARNP